MKRQHLSITSVRIVLAALALSIMTFASSCTAVSHQASLLPPPDFLPLAEVDLSSRPFDREILGQFTLEETTVVNLFYTLPSADTPYFDLSLIGPEEDSRLILHSEDYHTDENGGGTWEQSLPPGTYRLALTAETGSGLLSVYWGHP